MQYTLIYLVLIKLLSLFGERDVYNATISQPSCDKENMTRPRLLVLSRCCQWTGCKTDTNYLGIIL